jgi:hypothetical protein
MNTQLEIHNTLNGLRFTQYEILTIVWDIV